MTSAAGGFAVYALDSQPDSTVRRTHVPAPSRAGSRPQAQPPAKIAETDWDVVVIGGGNAGLVSALAASDHGARVLLVERAPRHMRGGNTRHTRNIRCVQAKDAYGGGSYPREELWSDLCGVGDGPEDRDLAWQTITESESMPAWMADHGIRWQAPLAGTLHLSRTNRFFLGGGKALVNAYYREISRRPKVSVLYDTAAEDLNLNGDTCTGVRLASAGRRFMVSARAVVCASGGFEANIEWLRSYWGAAADNYVVRGTPYNDGMLLARLYEASAARAGQERGFHAIAVDYRSPPFDGGIATRLDSIPFGIVVNKAGERFYDEGEDIWPKRYAMWGRHIAAQEGQLAFSLWDAKVKGLFLPPMFEPYSSNDLGTLATSLGVDPAGLRETVARYNAAIGAGGLFNHQALDGCRTVGLTPPKTHWALPLDTPPYFGVPMRPGITFTYMGVAVDSQARVMRSDGSPFRNLFAAGEIMSGNVLSNGYLAGFGLTIGSVWGREAGTRAANHGC